MADLDKVVDLDAGADAGFSHAGAIDGGVGLNFDGVFENSGAGLHDLVPDAGVVLGEAEAVAADDCPILEHDMVTDAAVLADDGVGVGEEIVPDGDVGIDHDVRQQGRVVADGYAFADDGEGSDVGVFADDRSRVNDGGSVDAGRIHRAPGRRSERSWRRQDRGSQCAGWVWRFQENRA